MNYLIYVEHSAENLQFFLWLKDFEKRFAEAKTSDISLAPEWTQEMEDEAIAKLQKEKRGALRREQPGAEIFRDTDFEKGGDQANPAVEPNPFNTPPQSPRAAQDQNSPVTSRHGGSTAASYRSQANGAFAAAGAPKPCKSLKSEPSLKYNSETHAAA